MARMSSGHSLSNAPSKLYNFVILSLSFSCPAYSSDKKFENIALRVEMPLHRLQQFQSLELLKKKKKAFWIPTVVELLWVTRFLILCSTQRTPEARLVGH